MFGYKSHFFLNGKIVTFKHLGMLSSVKLSQSICCIKAVKFQISNRQYVTFSIATAIATIVYFLLNAQKTNLNKNTTPPPPTLRKMTSSSTVERKLTEERVLRSKF